MVSEGTHTMMGVCVGRGGGGGGVGMAKILFLNLIA